MPGSFAIEMTGTEDYAKLVNMALCGFPGSGKTIWSSTAPSPFFIFFKAHPQIMSIANRNMPHAKVLSQFDAGGNLIEPVWDVLYKLIEWIDERGEAYETIVVDTGDELQKALKEAKKTMNRGKWAIGDWGWLIDTYREVMNRILDMDKNVIVTYHLKNTQAGDDGEIVRELDLQGAAKDEAAGWFDIVGVLDAWEEDTDEGKLTRRGILTKTTGKYAFAKDHSGSLPKVLPVSEDFVGDFDRMTELIFARSPKAARQVIDTVEIETQDPAPTTTTRDVPTQEEIAAKKKGGSDAEPDKAVPAADETDASVSEAGEDPGPIDDPSDGTPGGVPEVVGGEPGDSEAVAEVPPAEEDGAAPGPEGVPVTEGEALEAVSAALGAVEVATVCEVCGVQILKKQRDKNGEEILDGDGNPCLVPDGDMVDLSMIRFREVLCRDDFDKKKKGK